MKTILKKVLLVTAIMIIASTTGLKAEAWNFVAFDATEYGYEAMIKSGDFIIVKDENNKWGCLDKDGKVILEATFNVIHPFKNGKMIVGKVAEDGNMKYGYFDPAKKLTVDFTYDYVNYSHYGSIDMMPVGIKDENNIMKYGHINYNGEIVTEIIYDRAAPFYNGLAAVKIDGKYGFVNTNGELCIKPIYDYAGDFSDRDSALVRIHGIIRGLINRQGEIKYILYEGRIAWYSFTIFTFKAIENVIVIIILGLWILAIKHMKKDKRIYREMKTEDDESQKVIAKAKIEKDVKAVVVIGMVLLIVMVVCVANNILIEEIVQY